MCVCALGPGNVMQTEYIIKKERKREREKKIEKEKERIQRWGGKGILCPNSLTAAENPVAHR